MIHLSRRLQAICDMVPAGSCICDVGCDHAHVEIRLLQEGTITSALAMDVAEGPLAKARENLELTDLSDRCELRRSDGLAAYRPGEADVLICAGMGGNLMRSILEAAPEKAASFRELILSPHTRITLVRDWLRRSGFRILDEVFLEEDGKYYTVMKAVPPGVRRAVSSDAPAGCPGAPAAEGAPPDGPGDRARSASAGPDWDAISARVRAMDDEDIAQALVDRRQTLRLLEDDAFRQYAEDTFGPRVLAHFLTPGAGGGETQQTFLRWLAQRLRSSLGTAEHLPAGDGSESAALRRRQIRGEIGILQVLLFLYRIRNGTGSGRAAPGHETEGMTE